MGYAMAERLAKGGCDIAVWNRTKAKADPLSKYGAKVVNQLEELSTKDILFVHGVHLRRRQGGHRQGAGEGQAEDGGRVLFDFARRLRGTEKNS